MSLPDDFADDDDFWFQQRLADAEYAAYTCKTCRSHYDNHASADLSCPAYTTKTGGVVFSDVHRYSGPLPRST